MRHAIAFIGLLALSACALTQERRPCDPGVPHREWENCEAMHHYISKQDLEAVERRVLDDAAVNDRELKQAGRELSVPTVELTKASQHAFDSYMQAECERESAFARPGSDAGALQVYCNDRLMRERIDLLSARPRR